MEFSDSCFAYEYAEDTITRQSEFAQYWKVVLYAKDCKERLLEVLPRVPNTFLHMFLADVAEQMRIEHGIL